MKSRLLGSFPALKFGMSTRLGGVSAEPYGMNLSFMVGDNEQLVNRNRSIFFSQLGIDAGRIGIPGQVHSANVITIDGPGKYPDCDGLVTNTGNVFCCIAVADCIPIFLYDPKRSVIAGIHAGWRGTAHGIAPKAVSLMKKNFDSLASDICSFIGPGAGSCCYTVGPEVARQFPEAAVHRKGEALTVDLKKANALQLMEQGMEEGNIEISPECTICNQDLHSFRRDGNRSGRMMGIIGMVKEV